MSYRNTYVKINLNHIKNNVQKLVKHYSHYQYHFGVVKADSYSHYGMEVVNAIIDGGCNYLAVSSLDEALEIRTHFLEIPILCLGLIPPQYLEIASKHDITVTVGSYEYLMELFNQSFEKLKVHLKVNTGMNRLGFSSESSLEKAYFMLKGDDRIELEGIYTHIYDACGKEHTYQQFQQFELFTSKIPLDNIPIVHLTASDATALYPKQSYVNGCRFGIMMYGFTKNPDIKLDSTFQLVSEVIQIQTLKRGDTVGYDGVYQADKDNEKIAVVAIGYADGIVRANRGRTVWIHEKEYPIVGNICMDMLFVKIDDEVHLHDEVILMKDTEDVMRIAAYLHTVEHEVLCNIGKRVPRIYEL